MEPAHPSLIIVSPFPNVGKMRIQWVKDKAGHPAEEHEAIVDLDTGKVFCIVSTHYKLIRHESAIEQVERAIAERRDLGQFQVVTEFYNDRGRMRRTYRFLEIEVEISAGDPISPELIVFNSYDTAWPFIVLLGAFRIVCTNGLVVGEKFLHLRKRHIYELGQINVAEEIGTALKRFNQQATEWKGWTEKKLTPKVYAKVLETMKFGIKAKVEVDNKVSNEAVGFDADGFPVLTVWGFYNILTSHITHNSVSLNHRVEMESRLREKLRGIYSETTIEHIVHPHNTESLPDSDGFGALDSGCGENMKIWLRIRDDIVIDTAFWTNGCAATIACGSMVTDLIKGKTSLEALAITAQHIAHALVDLPEGNFHCAELAAHTLRMAIKDFPHSF